MLGVNIRESPPRSQWYLLFIGPAEYGVGYSTAIDFTR